MLVIKPRAIGDVLLSTAVTPNLRAAFPDARIDFLTEAAAGDIIRHNPYLDNAIVFSPRRDNFLSLLWRLNRSHYDLVIDLFCNPRSAQMTFATRAPLRAGYPFRGRAYAYNHHIQSRADQVHNVEFNLDALRSLGIPVVDTRPVLAVSDEARRWAAEYVAAHFPPNTPVIALNPSGTWESKRWGLEHFAELGDALIEQRACSILLVWGPGELDDVRHIASLMRHAPIIPPASTLQQLAALFTHCTAMVSNDSGPMHIAAIMGTPTLGIFGPTNPLLQGPYSPRGRWIRLEGLDCLACNRTICPIGTICMRDLTVAPVLDATRALLEEHHDA